MHTGAPEFNIVPLTVSNLNAFCNAYSSPGSTGGIHESGAPLPSAGAALPTNASGQILCKRSATNTFPGVWQAVFLHFGTESKATINSVCPATYTFNSAIRLCERTIPDCPPNAHGPSCACDAGFRFDATGTQCIAEQYTLKLDIQDQTIEPKRIPGNTMPDFTTLTATVTDSSGSPQAGAQVNISVEVEETSGAHLHHQDRPLGAINKTSCGIVSKPVKPCASGNTGADGKAAFKFDATELSGRHTLAAECGSPTCSGKATASIEVKVDKLGQITASDFYTLVDADGSIIGATATHQDNHHATATANKKLIKLAEDYQKGTVNPGQKLYLNDASLPLGGKFEPHTSHRVGDVIDIRADSLAGRAGEIPFDAFDKFRAAAAKTEGIDAQIHCYHWDPNKDKYRLVIASAANPAACDDLKRGRHFHVIFK